MKFLLGGWGGQAPELRGHGLIEHKLTVCFAFAYVVFA